MEKEDIVIVGFGRFGQTLYRLLQDDFTIHAYDPYCDKSLLDEVDFLSAIPDIYQYKTIFFSVPISRFAQVITAHKPYITKEHTLIDTLSIKLYPAKIFEEELADIDAEILLTHPMFGPDSSKDGFTDLPIVLDQFKMKTSSYTKWKAFFQNKNLRVVEMSAELHDQTAAKSQGVTHFLGRLLDEIGFSETAIDTAGAKKLVAVKEQTCHDTWELFADLQHYNPYTAAMRMQIGNAYNKLFNELLPKRINPDLETFGIQGGKGSFNEAALQSYLEKNNIEKYAIEYLYTTEKVLKQLTEGWIDYGIFAISNSTGGLVEETVKEIGKYRFSIVAEIDILISHSLMKRKDTKEITTIIAHPQVFKQCEKTLQKDYPDLIIQTGEGELIDTAKNAEELANGRILKSVGILGPAILATLYDFAIIADNLQDSNRNITKFLLVQR